MSFRIDRLGITLTLLVLMAASFLPFLAVQPNRIMPGQGVGLFSLLQHPGPLIFAIALLPTLLTSCLKGRLWLNLALASLTLVLLIIAAGQPDSALLADKGPFARLSLGSGYWAILLLLGLMITDTLTKLAVPALPRLLLISSYTALIFLLLAGGVWDKLSLVLEYNNQPRFWQQGVRHLVLALGSILPALLLGIPLGIRCHRSPRLRAALLPLLGLLQTIPSLAMFGLLMIPLSLLTHAFPSLTEMGIRGIGVTPALIALFLYSLLPIVSNTAIGFDRLDPNVLEAARGMGMSPAQKLWQVELPLAMPVILSGLRIVVTMNIGLVAVAGLIGGGGYGTYIFQGLGQTATDLVLLGTLPTLFLAFFAALLIDTLIALSNRKAT